MNLTNFRTITIDVGTANEPIPPTILSASDHDGRIVKVRLFDGPSATSESGLGARLLYTTADGVGGYATMAAVTGEPTLSWSVPVPTEALAPGRRTMAVQITDGTRVVTTRTFDVIVEPYLIDGDAPEAQDALSEFRAAVEVLGGLTIPIPILKGGTGLTSSPSMLVNLGSTSAADVMQASPRPGVTGTLPVANGGSGATTAASAPWLLKTGGTLTGKITMSGKDIDLKASNITDGTAPSGNTNADSRLIMRDSGGASIGIVGTRFIPDGREGVDIYAHRVVGGADKFNSLDIYIDASGESSVILSAPAAWREAIGIGAYGSRTGLASQMTLTQTAANVSYNTFSGVNCSSYSGGIKVASAGTYEVWGQIYTNDGFVDQDLVHCALFADSNTIIDVAQRMNGTTYQTILAGPAIVELSAGAIVYLRAYNQTAARGKIGNRTGYGLYVRRIG